MATPLLSVKGPVLKLMGPCSLFQFAWRTTPATSAGPIAGDSGGPPGPENRMPMLCGAAGALALMLTLSSPMIWSGDGASPLSSTQQRLMVSPSGSGEDRLNCPILSV